jgi:hypothetical protein
VVIGETGDLSNYAGVRKVWKRLGLAVYEGRAYSTWRRKGGLTAEEWTAAGYKPTRLAEIFSCVTEPMAKHQIESAEKSNTGFGRPKGKYGEVYVKRREQTLPLCDDPEYTRAHAQRDALRIMTKALIADLWSAWKGSVTTLAEVPRVIVAPSTPIPARAVKPRPARRKNAA